MDTQKRIKDLLERGRFDDARSIIESALQSVDTSELQRSQLHVNKAQLLVRYGDHEASLDVLNDLFTALNALKIDGNSDVNWELLHIDTCVAEADALCRLGQFEGSTAALNRAAEALENLDGEVVSDKRNEQGIQIQLQKGVLNFRSGEYDQALECLEPLINRARDLKLSFYEAEILNTIANTWNSKGEYGLALDCHGRCLSIREELGSKQDIAVSLNNIGVVYKNKGDLDLALTYYLRSLELKEQVGNRQQIAMSLNNIGIIHRLKGDLDLALSYYERSLASHMETGNKQNIAGSLNNIGFIHWNRGELGLALVCHERSLELFREIGNKQDIALSMDSTGLVYKDKGELDLALDFHTRSLALYHEIGNKQDVAQSLMNIGAIHRDKGEFQLALNQFRRSLSLREEVENEHLIAATLFEVVRVALDMDDDERAVESVERLRRIHEHHKANRRTGLHYQLAKALQLKSRNRRRDRHVSQEILDAIVHDEDDVVDHRLKSIAVIHLCGLLLEELQIYGEEEIVSEINDLAVQLLETARAQFSHSLIGEVYLLQSRLALLELDLKRSQRMLTQSQIICEEKGLRRLAIRISWEYDKLLDQMETWESFVENTVPMSERVKLAQLDNFVNRMIKKKSVDAEEPLDVGEVSEQENPFLLMIMAAGSGVSHYSRTFQEEGGGMNEQLFSGFVSSILRFAGHIFEESLDRIKLEEYTVLVKPYENDMLVCYAFKGQSYSANEKLQRLVGEIKADLSLWKSLQHSFETGAALKYNDTELLNLLISRTFATEDAS